MADAGQAMGAAGSLISGMAGFQAGKGNARLRRAEAMKPCTGPTVI